MVLKLKIWGYDVFEVRMSSVKLVYILLYNEEKICSMHFKIFFQSLLSQNLCLYTIAQNITNFARKCVSTRTPQCSTLKIMCESTSVVP